MNQKPSNGAGVASLVVGIIGVIFSFIIWISIIGLILGIVGCVMSSISRKNIGPNGIATAGLVLSIIAIVFGSLLFSACMIACGGIGATAACTGCMAI